MIDADHPRVHAGFLPEEVSPGKVARWSNRATSPARTNFASGMTLPSSIRGRSSILSANRMCRTCEAIRGVTFSLGPAPHAWDSLAGDRQASEGVRCDQAVPHRSMVLRHARSHLSRDLSAADPAEALSNFTIIDDWPDDFVTPEEFF